MSIEQIREVGKALLPYLRNDLTDAELGMAAHDAVAALNRAASMDSWRDKAIEWERQNAELCAELDRLRAELEKAMRIVGASLHSDAATERIKLENDRLRAELAKRQWQPIDIVPRDGHDVLLALPTRPDDPKNGTYAYAVAAWDADPTPGWLAEGALYHPELPTHWQPLPPPPDGG